MTTERKQDIAIIGMACRFPDAASPPQYWRNLAQGKSAIRTVPPDRWRWEDYFGDPQKEENKTNSRWGGFIEDVDKFDPRFFSISPKEANYIDPQHRLFIEAAWHAIEDAGYAPSELSGKKIGVYAGVSKNDYAELIGTKISAFVSTGTVHSILANRVSYFFNFHGPSEAIDTACSSSLVALHNAARDIRDGECEAAIVGGVNALLSPRMYISHAKSGMLSADGQCKTFDQAANGYVRGEGVGVLLLKALDVALSDRDQILGVIKATAVNHGGKANFLTAPNVSAQADVIYAALKKADVDPRNITYVEAHGTGTPLGDPIEINALKKAYEQYFKHKNVTPLHHYCGLGSVKTNIGHLESAAGMASIIKVLLAMKHGVLPPVVNFHKLNPYISLDGSPFYILERSTEWKRRELGGELQPRQAAVSGFGMGGVNAHVILEEATKRSPRLGESAGKKLILLSAREGRVRAQAQQLLDHLRSEEGKEQPLEDIAFTLMFGRAEFPERLACVASSTEELANQLERFLQGELPASCHAGTASGSQRHAPVTGDLAELAHHWVSGAEIEWEVASFHGHRVSLPGYPFARQRCWFEESPPAPADEPAPAAGPAERPAASGARDVTVHAADEMIRDHVVRGEKMLPAVGYLELVRQGLPPEAQAWSFSNLYWLTPTRFDETSRNLTIERAGRIFTIKTGAEVHCQGSIEAQPALPPSEALDLQAIFARCSSSSGKDELYRLFARNGLEYGPSFQVLDTLRWNEQEAVGTVDTENASRCAAGILDGGLQSAVGLSVSNETAGGAQFVPYFAERFHQSSRLADVRHYYVKQQQTAAKGVIAFDVFYCDGSGQVLAVLRKLTKRALETSRGAIHYYTAGWREDPGAAGAPAVSGALLINGEVELDAGTPRRALQLGKAPGPEEIASALAQVRSSQFDFSHVIVRAVDPGRGDLQTLLLLAQSLIKARLKHAIKLLYVGPDSGAAELPYLFAAGGLARTLKYEYPRIDLEVIGFDKGVDWGQALRNELRLRVAPLHEVLYRGGRRFSRAITSVDVTGPEQDLPLRRGGAYLITGGAGGLGQIFAELLAGTWQARLALLGRRARDGRIDALLASIEKLGGSAVYLQTDIGDERALIGAVGAAREQFGSINGVLQAAGVIEDGFILRKSAESFGRVIQPKIQGTALLDRATAEDDLDFFAMFSSVASLMPNQGQCDYASGNSFLDHFAAYRQQLVAANQRSGLSLALNWPLWASGGMQVTDEEKRHLLRVFGMQPLSTENGLALFQKALRVAGGQGLGQLAGLEGDKAKIDEHFHVKQRPVVGGVPEELLPKLVRRDLYGIVAQAFRVPPGQVRANTSFAELGAESLSLLTMTRLLNHCFAIDFKPTLLFDYGTAQQIEDHILQDKRDDARQSYEKLGSTGALYRTTSLIDLDKSDASQGAFQRRYDNHEFYMVDHVVGGKYNVPGACYIEMARQAGCLAQPGQKVARLTNNYWAKQLSSSGEPFLAYLGLERKDGRADYTIYSKDEAGQQVTHATGTIHYASFEEGSGAAADLDLRAIRERCTTRRTREEVYEQIHAEGLKVGPTFMPMQGIVLSEREALATLELPEAIEETYWDYLLHPTMLTGVFQTALINNRIHGDDQRDFIPIAIEGIEVLHPIPRRCLVYSEASPKTVHNRDIKKFDLTLCDESGHVLARLTDFALKTTVSSREATPSREAPPRVAEATPAGSTDDFQPRVLAYLRNLLAPVLGIEPSAFKANESFDAYGINSVLILELNKVLEGELGGDLSRTLFFEYKNLAELSSYLAEEHREALAGNLGAPPARTEPARTEPARTEPARTEPARTEPARAEEPIFAPLPARVKQLEPVPVVPVAAAPAPPEIAIIGVAGRYPHADTLEAFWANLKAGRDSIEEIPPDRFDYAPFYDPDRSAGKLYGKWGSFIADIDKFDPLFFNISPREAEQMDPQERLFLQTVWHTLEDAGYTRHALRGSKVGVFVGALWQPYLELAVLARQQGDPVGPSTLLYSIANRVSYCCDFRGPSMAVDTACSSSFTALHLACQSIRSGESELAIAGGVNLSVGASKYLFLSQNNFLSSDGRCRSFGAGGDGYVPGEGVGAVLLKPLHKAAQDGDHIYGVIKATAINHGGKTNGYTVPNPNAQAEMIREALEQGQVHPRAISYVEAHGTGTALGDPIEITGLTKAFSKQTKERGYCAIGSVKSNIGHLEASAGIAGLTKVLLQMQYRQIAPSLHSAVKNSNLDLAHTPFVVPQELIEWKRPVVELDGVEKEYPRIAGISSFGAGGSNAHVLVEEYIPGRSARASAPEPLPVVIVLSARNESRLRERARQLAEEIQSGRYTDDDLVDIAYTLQVGREEMEERLALVASSLREVEKKLDGFLQGRPETDGLYRGQADGGREILGVFGDDDEDLQDIVGKWMRQRKHAKLAKLWASGLSVGWSRLYGETRPQRISLPVYPFAKERYWLPETATWDANAIAARAVTERTAARAGSVTGAALHPLVQEDTSTPDELRFSSTFDGREFFLADHIVDGRVILPGVAYLEMARAAIAQVMAADGAEPRAIRLHDVVWIQPIVVHARDRRVHVALEPQGDRTFRFSIHDGAEHLEEEAPFSQGLASITSMTGAQAAPFIDLAAVRARCVRKAMTHEQFYETMRAKGYHHGPTLRGVEAVYFGAGEALTRFSLPAPAEPTEHQFVLHPSMLDSPIQVGIGIALDFAADPHRTRRTVLPFSLDGLEIFARCPQSMWAVLTDSSDSDASTRKLDIDLCDERGMVCVRMRGFASRVLEKRPSVDGAHPEVQEQAVMLSPVWEPVHVEGGPQHPTPTERVVIVAEPGRNRAMLQAHHPAALIVELGRHDTIEAITSRLRACGSIEHVIWMAPDAPVSGAEDEAIIASQRDGVLQCFRMVKALLALGYGTRSLGWTVITVQSQALHARDVVNPAHASVHGFIGSLAKEYPGWSIRLVDLPREGAWPLAEVFRLPPDEKGNAQAYRHGRWHAQQLLPFEAAESFAGKVPYRTGGVYVVIGGAGGIGHAWTEYMIRHHRAHVVWIGRRARDAEIQRKLDLMAALGPAPLYISADATDRDDLLRACREIKRHHAAIHGVLHSAIVLNDHSLANMPESQFEAALSAKVDVSVRIAQVFREEPLDFVVFFSSLNSFLKPPGQSNYAAGCTFKDAFASQLAKQWPCAVKVINWGFWGSIGVVASDVYRARMAQIGMGSIEPEEAMAAMETVLAMPLNQLAFLKSRQWMT
ncbi:SDR family NAD(P)-dependent oxidoreductase [Sorangium sp. So ce887]|uniref:SDR family NAD(P)-dependent oxidoreductase n=1 Tax=Sorangium sp. So ce887 TaxID=3133324 RepID=UPI003F613068